MTCQPPSLLGQNLLPLNTLDNFDPNDVAAASFPEVLLNDDHI